MSETDITCLWEIVHANFGVVGITIDAGECVYLCIYISIAEIYRWEEMNRQMSRGLKLPWEG